MDLPYQAQVNPCDLLTKKEVENALSGDFGSVTVVDVEIEKDQPRCVCWYSYYEGGKAGRHHSVGVYYSRGKKALEMLEWVKERTRKGNTIYDQETESISSLGDEAYWTGGNRLVVRVKNGVREIYPLTFKGAGIKMAKIAIQRIK